MSEERFEEKRQRMVENQIKARGITDTRVLAAIEKVPRHRFVPERIKSQSYNDEPLSIGEGQTISQPYIVAYMTEMLQLDQESRVLEIGTGSGYQTAILAEIAKDVYTVELIESLSRNSRRILAELGYKNIQFKVGDGSFGWEECSPFDAVIVTAAPVQIPLHLQEQLNIGGKLIVPIGEMDQDLWLVSREKSDFKKKKLLSVRFVPLVTPH